MGRRGGPIWNEVRTTKGSGPGDMGKNRVNGMVLLPSMTSSVSVRTTSSLISRPLMSSHTTASNTVAAKKVKWAVTNVVDERSMKLLHGMLLMLPTFRSPTTVTLPSYVNGPGAKKRKP